MIKVRSGIYELAMEKDYQEIAVRIQNIFDSKSEEEAIRAILEPDGWKVDRIQDDPHGQRHLIFRRPKP